MNGSMGTGRRRARKAWALLALLFPLVGSAQVSEAVFVIAPPGPACSEAAARVEVRHADLPDARGCTSCPRSIERQAFRAGDATCSVTWSLSVNESEPGRVRIAVDQDCERALPDPVLLHDAALCRIAARLPKTRLATLSLGHPDDLPAWQERMAVASARSMDVARQLRGADRRSPNALFVRVFNDANVASELTGIFAKQGLRLPLSSVEKVFSAMPAKNLPFAAAHPELRDRKTRVLTGAGMYEFRVEPFGAKPRPEP